MSHQLLRNLLEAALNKDLSQNEWRVFAALLYKTLGYGKQVDSPHWNQLAQLTHIRKDRVQPAVLSVLEKGIFEALELKRYRQTYKIPDVFFAGEVQSRFFAPNIPKNAKTTRAVVAKTHSPGTNRKTIPTDLNHDNSTPRGCGESELVKPVELSANDFAQLAPALAKLPSFAQSILDLLALAIRQGTIRTTPVRLGFGLIKQAQAGNLNTSALQTQQQQTEQQTATQLEAQMQALKREAAAITAMYQHASIPIPEDAATRIQLLANQYQALKAQRSVQIAEDGK